MIQYQKRELREISSGLMYSTGRLDTVNSRPKLPTRRESPLERRIEQPAQIPLQLPLERPHHYGEPGQDHKKSEDKPDRGVTDVDFYI